MTEEYKNILRDYLTGKLEQQTSPNIPRYSTRLNYDNELYSYLEEKVPNMVPGSFYLLKGIDGNGNQLDEQLLYGVNGEDNSTFIVILDTFSQPLQFIDSYSSGTKFGFFESLIIDDDGRFYGVEYVNDTEKRRFVMLNNILVKAKTQEDYRVSLRQSYYLPDELQVGTFNKLIKKPLGNKYLFCITDENSKPVVEEFTINVGIANEWRLFGYTWGYKNEIKDAWASWDSNDNITLRLIGVDTDEEELYILDLNGESLNIINKFQIANPTSNWQQAVILNENKMYYSECYTVNGVYNQYLYELKQSEYLYVYGTMELLYTSGNEDFALPGVLNKSVLSTDGLNVFLIFNLPKADETNNYYVGILYGDNFYDQELSNSGAVENNILFATNVFHQFNLYKFFIQVGNISYTAMMIFNNNNYNGWPYTNLNSLVPRDVVLANQLGYLPSFARNLYNKVITENTTISTVEIPNTILNTSYPAPFDIQTQILYGETNVELVRNYRPFVKNQYETVDINFYNTILMVDRNDINNEKQNLNGAIRLNKNVSNNLSYNFCKATKIIINYDDGTHSTMSIDPSTQIQIIDNVARYTFDIYAPTNKNIINLEIYSGDIKTKYAEINGTFEEGKYYTITQDVWVE